VFGVIFSRILPYYRGITIFLLYVAKGLNYFFELKFVLLKIKKLVNHQCCNFVVVVIVYI